MLSKLTDLLANKHVNLTSWNKTSAPYNFYHKLEIKHSHPFFVPKWIHLETLFCINHLVRNNVE